MPKKSPSIDREIRRRIETDRFLRRLESEDKQRIRRRQEARRYQSKFVVAPPKGLKKNNGYVDLQVPETLDLIADYELVANLVQDIRRIALGDKRPVRLIFDIAKRIKPAALLLLLAELHRCRLVHGPSRVTGTYPTEKRIERMLQHTGFFKMLGVAPRTKHRIKRYPLDYIEFASESKTTQGTARYVRQELFGDVVVMDGSAKRQLTRAINEAMLNAGQHAYPTGSYSQHPSHGRWWLAGHFNKKRGELMIMFCDLGVGIAKTLPKRYPMELIMSVLSLLPGIKPNDAEMIKAGMMIGRTRTMKEGRGKGLNDLRRFVEEAGTGELHIFSRYGHYRYRPGESESLANYRTSIGGTLIQWTVPLDKVSNWAPGTETDDNEDD